VTRLVNQADVVWKNWFVSGWGAL